MSRYNRKVCFLVPPVVFLCLLIFLTACNTGTDSLIQATPTAVNTSSPDTTAEDRTTSNPELPATATPGTVGGFDCAGVTQIPAAECAALVVLYNSTNGPGWADNNGWLTTNTPCSWTGITCTGDHVIDITLSYNQLTGPLPPALGNLSHLRVVQLGTNQLHGPIPAELGNLSELGTLYLWDNLLTGPIPAELGNLHKLRSLSLARNQLSGSILSALGKAVSLESLDLSHNQFSGVIPAELGELNNLYALNLSHNQLSGVIPVTFGNLSKLDELNLSYNQLYGPVPESVTHVKQHILWGNQVAGTITTDSQTPFNVDYMGIRFSADPSLATSIWPEVKPATPLPEVLDGPSYWLAIPEHIRFTFADPVLSPSRLRMGFNLPVEAQILVFPLAELANMNPLVQTQIETLRDLLAERGQLPSGELPLLPLTNSAQVFNAQAQYFDSDTIQGIRFISQHSQDPHPIILSPEIFYTFQGLTDDGAYYVAAFFPLTTDALPDTIDVEDWDAFHANYDYDTYLLETTYTLEHLPREEHGPLLGRIYQWLRGNGYLLLSTGVAEVEEIVGQWLDVPMYFSCFDPETLKQMVQEMGFDIVETAVEAQMEGQDEVSYLWLLAQKKR